MHNDDFIAKANKKFNNKFNYIKAVYVNSNIKICIICPEHGEFMQSPRSHLISIFGCPACAKVEYLSKCRDINKKSGPVRNKGLGFFIQKAKEIHGDLFDYSKSVYIEAKCKTEIICAIHGSFWITPHKHCSGKRGCPKCGRDKANNSKKQPLIDFINEANIVHNNTYDYSQSVYINSSSNMDIICPIHGKFRQLPANHKNKKHICPYCSASSEEQEILNFLKNSGVEDIKLHDKTAITPLEIDLYIPSHKIGIEFHGLYWHGERKDKFQNYHLSKTQLANSKDIQLLQIFEHEWLHKKNAWKSLILSRLNKTQHKVFARKCIIVNLDSVTKNKFLNINHIQGEDKASHKYGLTYNDELVAVITFTQSRFNKNYQWECSRFCVKNNYSVVGGFSKLLKNFIREVNPENIISYCDKRYSIGNLYIKNDFEELSDSAPGYFYFKNMSKKILTRYQCQKHRLCKFLEKFDSNLTEWENMKNHGYDRIWDCGCKRFVWTQKTR